MEQPPTKQQIGDLKAKGTSSDDERRIVKRLQQSCYLDCNNRPLDAKKRLLAQYRKDGLVLFLGAGVSCGSGIPSWTCLIRRLLSRVGITTDYAVIQRVFPSLLSQFDLAAQKLSTPLDFARELYRCLYEDLKSKDLLKEIPKAPKKEAEWDKWDEVVTELQQNETLKAVGELLILDQGECQMRNPQIHAVLTTNADNLLEIYCRARTRGKSRILTMVDRSSVGDHPDRISVYHLHGSLDARGENIVRTDGPCGQIPTGGLEKVDGDLLPDLVFRESEYYEAIANPLSFVNHAPQSYLQRLNVLFVGTSLDDLNIRRWLYNSFCERVQHRKKYLREYYCHVYPDVEYEAKLESRRHFWLRTKTDVPAEVVDLAEVSAKELGVQIIWCDNYAEVQSCLNHLKQDGHEPNFDRRCPDEI